MEKVIGSTRRYLGTAHDGLCGTRVVIVSVQRGGDNGVILRDDAAVGTVRPDDVIEFAPIIHGDGPELPSNITVIDPAPGFQTERGERASWITSDARPWEFEPPLAHRAESAN
ncbi:MAG: hypothetical protein HY292_07780 [Planctomycetes bacterium]|nr:hypothetical protein [Planctomycetota bacterium]